MVSTGRYNSCKSVTLRLFLAFAFLLILGTFSDSYASCSSCGNSCGSCGRRPPVMVKFPDMFVDYAPEECTKRDEGESNIVAEDLQALQLQKEPYRITKGDILEVSIFTTDENGSGEVVVAPDGRVYFMFLDGIEAVGRTADELARDLEKGLSSIYSYPSVAVVPKVKAAEHYLIMGKVLRPGAYPLTTAIDLRSAIGEAGGLNDGIYRATTMRIASLANSFVIRDGKRLPVNFSKLIRKGDESQNIYMKPGDYVYIASALEEQVYVLGAFGGRMVPFKDDLSLVGALTPVFGPYTHDPYRRPNWTDVLIIRGNLECPCVIRANLCAILAGTAKDVYLLPGDIVYVPNQGVRFGKVLVRLAIDAFISGFFSSAGEFYINRIFNFN